MIKEDILKHASKYIGRFKGKLFVIKYGGSILDDESVSDSILDDIISLHENGIDIVLVHGGGMSISKLMKQKGKEPKFVNGLRITDEETAKIVDEALSEVNKQIVNRIISKGAKASSLISSKRLLIRGKLKPNAIAGDFVGDVDFVDASYIKDIIGNGAIPVISPIGTDSRKRLYNINADSAAAEVAAALLAEKLIILTNVKGVMTDKDDEASLISHIDDKKAEELIRKGIISGGMIPKVGAGLIALDKGIKKVHIISGRIKNSLLLEVFTDEGIGTEIVR